MSEQDKHGGPAFPVPESVFSDRAYTPEYLGMSLRDYFAAKSMTGCLPGRLLDDKGVEQYAEWAYRMADAMLKARDK